jgi:hypothetical protein
MEENPDDVPVGWLLNSPVQIAPILRVSSEPGAPNSARHHLGVIDGLQADWTILKF